MNSGLLPPRTRMLAFAPASRSSLCRLQAPAKGRCVRQPSSRDGTGAGRAGTGTDAPSHHRSGQCGRTAPAHHTSLHQRRWFDRHPRSGHQHYHLGQSRDRRDCSHPMDWAIRSPVAETDRFTGHIAHAPRDDPAHTHCFAALSGYINANCSTATPISITLPASPNRIFVPFVPLMPSCRNAIPFN